jgi:hypothetical protein
MALPLLQETKIELEQIAPVDAAKVLFRHAILSYSDARGQYDVKESAKWRAVIEALEGAFKKTEIQNFRN